MKQEQITVILPVYNISEDYLSTCLESLLQQTYSNIELILVDDGSQNNAPAIGRSYEEKDSRVTFFSQPHAGVSVARNLGLKNAHGAYICFVDPDDYVTPTYLEKLYRSITETKADIALCNAIVKYKDHEVKNRFLPGKKRVLEGNDIGRLQYQLVSKKLADYYPPEVACGTPWGKLYRRTFLEEHHLSFQPDLLRMQDNVFNLYALEQAKRVAFIPDFLYIYRKEVGSACYHYNPNIVDLFERYFAASFRFLEEYDKGPRVRKALLMKTLTSFNSYLTQNFFHEENPNSFMAVRKQLNALLRREPYQQALKELDYSLLTKSEQVFVFLLKHHCFRLLKLLIRLRTQYKM